jgi:hypothetical protein
MMKKKILSLLIILTILIWVTPVAFATDDTATVFSCTDWNWDDAYTIRESSTERVYENRTEIDPDFTLPAGWHGAIEYVDVTETHTAVLGEDGFYNLDRADGAIIYVDMNSDVFSFATALADPWGSGQIYVFVYDENGDIVKDDSGNNIKYNATAAIRAYLNAAENGYYPLTEDLIYFYQSYGKSQGWYIPGMSFIFEGDFDTDTGWMFACCYLEDGNAGGSENSMLSIAIAIAVISAVSIAVLPVIGKYFR